MRIALVTYALQVGGIETFLKSLGKYFINSRHKVVIYETLIKGKWSETFELDGFIVERIYPNKWHSALHHALKITDALRDFDLIILNDVPAVQSVIGMLPDEIVVIPVVHSTLLSMIQNASANRINLNMISAVSPLVRNALVDYGVDQKKVVCIHNGVFVENSWPKENHLFYNKSFLKLIFLGSINHVQKGVLYLPGIIKKATTFGAKISLDVIGNGPDMDELLIKFQQNCIDVPITFHGALQNNKALELLRRADVLIMPSHYEGLPIVLLEAAAMGVVPVVSHIEGCTDFVVDSWRNGVVVEQANEHGFAEALFKLSTDRDILKRMSFAAWETIHSSFTIEKMGASYLAIVEKCREEAARGLQRLRSGTVDLSLLGDFPRLPIILVRPVRKILRILGLMPKPSPQPLLFNLKKHG